MKAYSAFASVYDEFMKDIPYNDWCHGMVNYLKKNGYRRCRVLELGCGTGSFTRRMAASGYEMTGIDISQEMLYRAELRNRKEKRNISYELQDMRAFEFSGSFPVIVSVCDSVNYMENNFDLKSVMECSRDTLTHDGIFVFDMKTPAYYKKLGNQVFTDSTGKGTYIWENDFDSESSDNNYYMTFFIEKKHGLYEKFTEEHIQHAFTDDDVRNTAKAAGLEVRDVLGMNMTGSPDWDGERVYYVLKKR